MRFNILVCMVKSIHTHIQNVFELPLIKKCEAIQWIEKSVLCAAKISQSAKVADASGRIENYRSEGGTEMEAQFNIQFVDRDKQYWRGKKASRAWYGKWECFYSAHNIWNQKGKIFLKITFNIQDYQCRLPIMCLTFASLHRYSSSWHCHSVHYILRMADILTIALLFYV